MFTLQTFTLVLLLQGTLEQTPSVRIIGGSDSHEGEFPSMALITYEGISTCGCTIINPSWVLTAAHCVVKKDLQFFEIKYGSVNISSTNIKTVNISRIITHPFYEIVAERFAVRDIALLKVEPEIMLSDDVKVVEFPEINAPTPADKIGVAIGWGRIDRDSPDFSKILQKVQLPILSDEDCEDRYKEFFLPSYICAGAADYETDEDIFFGDSGGPLFYSNVQVGILSFADPRYGDGPYWPAVFTKVSLYIPWITGVISIK